VYFAYIAYIAKCAYMKNDYVGEGQQFPYYHTEVEHNRAKAVVHKNACTKTDFVEKVNISPISRH
jgi:hypothetical protein